MIQVRKSEKRGHFDHGWLNTYHTFSFADYHDPEFMGYRSLRVINEDRVQAGRGFGTHGHRDMEILSYVLEGALGHGDSMGTGSVIRPGDVQRMSAGTGVTHSEKNASDSDPVHFLQIWIMPDARGITPGYEQKAFAAEERDGKLRLVASREGREGSLTIHQDVDLYTATVHAGQPIDFALRAGRFGWVQVTRGSIIINGQRLVAGDGASIENETALTMDGEGEFLLFDLN